MNCEACGLGVRVTCEHHHITHGLLVRVHSRLCTLPISAALTHTRVLTTFDYGIRPIHPGTLEDVTMSVWMLAYGVQPTHLPVFVDAHTSDEYVEERREKRKKGGEKEE